MFDKFVFRVVSSYLCEYVSGQRQKLQYLVCIGISCSYPVIAATSGLHEHEVVAEFDFFFFFCPIGYKWTR